MFSFSSCSNSVRRMTPVACIKLSMPFIPLAAAQMFQKSVSWAGRTHQQTYTDVMARADFGSANGWNNNRAMISTGTLRITVEKNALSGAGGLISNTKIPDGTAYELDFDVRFHSQFEWSRGGKVGFGLGIGNGNTGCNLPLDGAGGTLRLMWYNNPSTRRVYFHPYIYNQGMPGPCGSNFGKSYPTAGTALSKTNLSSWLTCCLRFRKSRKRQMVQGAHVREVEHWKQCKWSGTAQDQWRNGDWSEYPMDHQR